VSAELRILSSLKEESKLLEEQINALPARPLQILEAGCGQHWTLKLGVPFELTGIDADADALAMRRGKDLKEAVHGDLRTIQLPEAHFDVVYSAFVLEHVADAEIVLANFARWLKPNGLMILLIPDRDSAYGFLTRMTPHWVHVLYYRLIVGYKHAGKPGHGPYPVIYDPVVSRAGLDEFFKANGLTVRQFTALGSYLKRSRLVRIVARTCSMLSLGRLAWRHNNLCFVAQKR
jgi:SAM-dependent methyltransferase